MNSKVSIPKEPVAACRRRRHIRRLALFDSVLRDAFAPDGDVDVLVAFEPGHTPGFEFFSKQEELSDSMGRNVDLDTPGFPSRYFRDRVIEEAEPLYGG